LVFSDRSPIPHVDDIQVGTPKRGRMKRIMINQTATKMTILIMVLTPFRENAVGRGTGPGASVRPWSAPGAICR